MHDDALFPVFLNKTVGVVKPQFSCFAQILRAFSILFKEQITESTIEISLSQLRLQGNGGVVVVDGTFIVATQRHEGTAIAEQQGVMRAELQCVVQVGLHAGVLQFHISTLRRLKLIDAH